MVGSAGGSRQPVPTLEGDRHKPSAGCDSRASSPLKAAHILAPVGAIREQFGGTEDTCEKLYPSC